MLGLVKICNSNKTLGLIVSIQPQLKMSGYYKRTVITPRHTRNGAPFLVKLQLASLLGKGYITRVFLPRLQDFSEQLFS